MCSTEMIMLLLYKNTVFLFLFFLSTGIDDIFRTACFLGLKDCLDLASELYTKWMANTSTNE